MTEKQRIKILEDWGDLIAVEKEAGWLSIPGRGNKEGVPIVSHILGAQLRGTPEKENEKRKEPDLFTIHRLDEGTSGVMLFARTAKAHQELNQLFESAKVKKTYWCLVKGIPKDQIISAPLFKLPSKKIKSIIDPKGKPSETKITVKISKEGYSLVEAEPLTGRSHQIRVHLSHVGAPLIGDILYGGPSESFGLKWTYPLLHCRQLQFEWPQKTLRIAVSQPSEDFSKGLEALGFVDGCKAL